MKKSAWVCACLFSLSGVLPNAVHAQDTPEWDVTQARGETRQIDFTTDEGTWLSVDVSPDGSWMVFDLLGHIYRAPTDGSSPSVSLTQGTGVAVNYHPRVSPDGSTIAFISDQKGQNNLWLMDVDGSNQRAVHLNASARASMPAWTPDGQYILVRRSYVGTGSRDGQSGIWMYHIDGGDGVALVDDGGSTWPSVSPDGRYVYFQHRQGSADALAGHYQVRRLDRMTGKIHDVTAGNADGPAASRASSGGGFAPEISPDGRYLAYGRQIPDGTIEFKGHEFGPRTALWIRDLETGSERLAMDPIGVAIESGSKSLRTLPGYAWSRDGRSIVIWAGGKVRRLDTTSGDVSTLEFDARVQRTLSGLAYQSFRIEDGAFDARFLRWHTGSPASDDVAFQAIGRVWLQSPGAEARRLTPDDFGDVQEFAPTWSPDGRWIAFTTWSDTLGGHVWRVGVRGGTPERLTTEPGEYVHPAWSLDGQQLVVAVGSGATNRGRTVTHNPWWDIATLPADGGVFNRIARVSLPAGMNVSSVARRGILAPSWGPDDRVFFPEFRSGDSGLETVLVSVRSDGLDARDHIVFPDADEAVPSPDGRWVAFQEGDNVYLTALPYSGSGAEPIQLNKRDGNLPVRRLSNEGGLFPRWKNASTVEFGNA
ncbi:MAG: Tol biopolymer transport system component, partial [Myxococcota bacterium]